MSVKTRVVLDKIPSIINAAKSLDGTKICAGVTGEQGWLAGIHEYGCHIPVTPKMRAYLHHLGVHLQKSTTEIVIPERSFLRAGFDNCKADVLRQAADGAALVLEGSLSEEDLYSLVGELLKDGIADYAEDLKDPPKSELSLKLHPGKANPLVLTGDMIGAISYEVKK